MATGIARQHGHIQGTSLSSEQSANVDDVERWVSGISGAALALYGARRRGVDGVALAALGAALLYRGVTGRSLLYQALDLRLVRTTGGRQRMEVVKAMTINRSPDELYRFWRNFENLPTVMRHLESVTVQDAQRSHWVVKGPGGKRLEWDAEIVNDKPGQLIAWQSCEGADVDHWGVVRFVPAPGGRGTQVTVELEYEPIGGVFGVTVAKLFGEEPGQQIGEDLRRFKQLMETGEVPTTEGQPRGK
ncbi:MAG: SRPBCC family protein [Nitrospirales bacterium]